jgi:hypothetical protein
MPRTLLAVTQTGGAYATAGVVATEQAADVGNGNYIPLTGGEIVVARNSGASSRTVTFTSVADSEGRLGDITAESVAAGAVHVFGPFQPTGWKQSSDGGLYINANHAEILFSVYKR